MKHPVVVYRADQARRAVGSVCATVSAVGLAIGLAGQVQDLAAGSGMTFLVALVPFFTVNSTVVDSRRRTIRRIVGFWPFVRELSRPFSEVDHVCVEVIPGLEADGSEYVLSRLSLVRKFGQPIVLTSGHDRRACLEAEATRLAAVIGVESKTAGPSMKSMIYVR